MADKKIEILEKKIEEVIIKASQLKKENDRLRAEKSAGTIPKEEIKKRVTGILEKLETLEG